MWEPATWYCTSMLWSIDSCQNKSCTLGSNRGIVHTKRDYSLLSTLIRFQKYAFSFSSKLHRSIRVHTTVLVRFRLSALKRSKTKDLHVVTYVELYVHASNRSAYDIFGHRFHFEAFSNVFERFRPSTLIGCTMYAFHSDETLRTFSNRWVVMKMLSVLVWTKRL